MSITHAIVHQLFRNSTTAELNLREEELEQNEQLSDLINFMKTAFYNRSSKQYGQFSEESGHFKALTGQWQQKSVGFVTMSQQLMKQLQLEIEEKELEFEGHWLFANESLEDGDYLWFFHLKHKNGIALTQKMDITDSSIIDFSKLGFGGVVDLTALAGQDQKYLTVSFGFGDRQLQSALLEFVNFVDTINTAVDTERFMEIVKAYSETLPPEKGGNYRRKAIEYCAEQDKLGETVVANEISVVLNDEVAPGVSQSLVAYMENTQPEAKKEFIPDRKSLKKYLRYTGKSKEVSISFSNEILGKNVNFDPSTESLTITNLPAALLKQLKEELGIA
ncbi:nucleoid-associated protein [Reinekea sp. G2M2-21]|uniref:nucleoid-associated protein n=1 Tax=Reinekea sp. G2M2-21 TaxID=2788942 RepID=UPI0018AA0FE5|nr:nucleoid-associated protein [Reinekea sp. G2M2-21]